MPALQPAAAALKEDALSPGLADVLADHAFGETAGAGKAVVAQAHFVVEAQDLDDLSHVNSRSLHPHFLVMKKKGMPVRRQLG